MDSRVADGAGQPDLPTQLLPVIRTQAPPAPAGDRIGWREVRLSREVVVDDEPAVPVSRARLVLVFGMLAATAFASVVALGHGWGQTADLVGDPDSVAGGSAFGDGPSFGSTPQRATLDAPPPPQPSAGPVPVAPSRASATGTAGRGRTATGSPAASPPVASPRPAVTPPRPAVRHAPPRPTRSSKGGARATAPGSVLEAEAAANGVGGSAYRVQMAGLYHGGAVSGLGRTAPGQAEGWVRFTGVQAPRSGQYAVTLYYAMPDGARQRILGVTVRVNGRAAVTLGEFPVTRHVQSKIIWVTLHKGLNVLRFGNAYGPAPTIDRIQVRPAG